MNNLIKSIILLVFFALLTGCAQKHLVLDVKQKYNSYPFEFVDLRPSEQKEKDIGSVWITSCDYGIHTLADNKTVPSKITLLKDTLKDNLDNSVKKVTLHHFSVYQSLQIALKNHVNSQFGELSSIINKIEAKKAIIGCEDNKYKSYNLSEAGEATSPYIISIILSLNDGEKEEIRIVYPDYKTTNKYRGEWITEMSWLQGALVASIDKIIKKN